MYVYDPELEPKLEPEPEPELKPESLSDKMSEPNHLQIFRFRNPGFEIQ
jgi:hypothetical protein